MNTNSEVAHHFNLKNHVPSLHFSFNVFIGNIINDDNRKSIETDIINILLANDVKIMNIKIPNYEHIKSLTFKT